MTGFLNCEPIALQVLPGCGLVVRVSSALAWEYTTPPTPICRLQNFQDKTGVLRIGQIGKGIFSVSLRAGYNMVLCVYLVQNCVSLIYSDNLVLFVNLMQKSHNLLSQTYAYYIIFSLYFFSVSSPVTGGVIRRGSAGKDRAGYRCLPRK